MKTVSLNQQVVEKFGSYTFVIGTVLIVLGTAGVFLPDLMSLGTSIFFGWLLISASLFWAMHTFTNNPDHIMDWLKPALLLITGGILLFSPVTGIASIGLLLAFYLLMDAFGSFSLSQNLYPGNGWLWMTFNGLVSAVLAGLFLVGWPESSLWLVGLYIGISLIFDGWALVFIGWSLRKEKNT